MVQQNSLFKYQFGSECHGKVIGAAGRVEGVMGIGQVKGFCTNAEAGSKAAHSCSLSGSHLSPPLVVQPCTIQNDSDGSISAPSARCLRISSPNPPGSVSSSVS